MAAISTSWIDSALSGLSGRFDFDDAVAVADAVDALLQWRDDVEQDFCRRPRSYPTR